MIAAALVAAMALAAPAQQAREARVTITVVDQTGAVIPNAKVTITPAADAKAPAAAPGAAAAAPLAEPATTNDKGIATIAGLAPGRVTITAEFPGFEPRVLKDITIRTGDNKHAAVLVIQ